MTLNQENNNKEILPLSLENIHILADFDGTLTKGYSSDGNRIPGILSVVRKEKMLGEQFTEESEKLFQKYFPIEHDPLLTKQQKIPAMEVRWTEINRLLVTHKLHHNHIKSIATSGLFQRRDDYKEFFSLIQRYNIPLTIVSAGNFGQAFIEFALDYFGVNHHTISVVSNNFVRDDEGYARQPILPVMHTYNKDAFPFSKFPRYDQSVYKGRTHGLLLGDSLGDKDILKNGSFTHTQSYCFLNKISPDQNDLIAYHDTFDHLLQRDQSLEKITTLITKIAAARH